MPHHSHTNFRVQTPNGFNVRVNIPKDERKLTPTASFKISVQNLILTNERKLEIHEKGWEATVTRMEKDIMDLEYERDNLAHELKAVKEQNKKLILKNGK